MIKTLIRRFLTSESGATAIEYAIIASLISIAAVAGMTTIGTKVSSSFANAGAKL